MRLPQRLVAAVLALGFLVAPLASKAGQVSPMEQLARDLGTPKNDYTARNDAHTNSMFEWVPANENVNKWTKMFTVVANQYDVAKTASGTRSTIARLHGLMVQQHVKVIAYDVHKSGPPAVYFDYVIKGEINIGVIFSPVPGIVTIQQVAAHKPGVITSKDIARIKGLIAHLN